MVTVRLGRETTEVLRVVIIIFWDRRYFLFGNTFFDYFLVRRGESLLTYTYSKKNCRRAVEKLLVGRGRCAKRPSRRSLHL